MNKKNYCNYHKKEMECEDCEQFEAFITDCEKTNNGWCCGFLCEKCKDYMAQDKELKKDKLYLLEIEYGCEREDGSMFMAKSLLVGYVVGKEDRFFYGSLYDQFDDGHYGDGGTMNLSIKEFNDWVKSVKEIT